MRRTTLPLALATLALLVFAAPAAAVTLAPQLIAPTASEISSTPLQVTYELPEAAASGSLTLTFSTVSHTLVTTVTLGSAAGSMGEHSMALDLHKLTSSAGVTSAAPANALADGVYDVTLSYQNVGLEPAASTEVSEVTIRTATQAPSLTAPAAGAIDEPFEVTYSLPEAALSGSVTLLFDGELNGLEPIALTNTAAGSHTISIDPLEPGAAEGVASAPATLPTDSYKLTVIYQDALGNPVAVSSSVDIRITRTPLCEPGSYSGSGESPCTEAEPGHYVDGFGATAQSLCDYGRYAPEKGATVCTPAEFGHFVSKPGASEQAECEAGTFTDFTDSIGCLPVPAGHYSEPGATLPTPCPVGTNEPSMRGATKAACKADAPGFWSAVGAATETACEPGTFAPSFASSECMSAAPGSYVEASGSSSEQPCPAGSYSAVSHSTKCTATPAGTYATGGATEATPCPTGTESLEGASACTTPKTTSTTSTTSTSTTSTPSTSSTNTSANTNTGATATGAVTPQPKPLSVSLSAALKQPSLRLTSRQKYTLRCSASATLQARVSALIVVGSRRILLKAPTQTVHCVAVASTTQLARFKLSKAALALLAKRGVKVSLAVALYPAGGGASIAIGSVQGRA